MELIIGLIVIAVVGYFVFFHKKAEAVAEPVAEYKVEKPAEVVAVAVADTPVTVAVEGAGVVEVPAKAPRKPRAPKSEVAKNPAVKKAPAKAKATKAPAKKAVVRTTARSKKV